MADKKLFAGARLKSLRKQLDLTQVKMAADIGVSASYLNLMERNQRPLSARVLIRLAEAYQFDLKSFTAAPEHSTLLALREAAADPSIEAIGLDMQDLKELADAHPRAAQALILLHQSKRGTASDLATLADRFDDRQGAAGAGQQPLQQVRDVMQDHGNYYPALEDAAEVFAVEARLEPGNAGAAMQAFLLQVHGVRTRILPADVMRGALRRYDRHGRRLGLNELLTGPGRSFQLAVQSALLEQRELLDEMETQSALVSRVSRRLYRLALANYFAAALLMPYDAVLTSARALRYDLQHLRRRFGVSLEQLCQRLTTLRKPGACGVDFFLLRTDPAGNITKRFGAASCAFAKTGGSCARLALWQTPARCGEIVPQHIALENGSAYFTLSSAIAASASANPFAPARRMLMLLCPAEEAKALVYADGFDLDSHSGAIAAGLNCRLCERAECAERAFAPLNKRLYVDEHKRAAAPFSFAP